MLLKNVDRCVLDVLKNVRVESFESNIFLKDSTRVRMTLYLKSQSNINLKTIDKIVYLKLCFFLMVSYECCFFLKVIVGMR